MKTLILFLDNLHGDYLSPKATPFLSELAAKGDFAHAETVLGYSSAIRNTLFTGATPRDHGKWSKFRLSSTRTPFRDLGIYRAIDLIPSSFLRRCVRFGCSKTTLRARGRKIGYSQLSIENVPMDILPQFDFTEEDITKERGAVPTIFEIMETAGVKYSYVSLPLLLGSRSLEKVDRALDSSEVVVVYTYNLDAAGHRVGVEAPRFDSTKRYVDKFLKSVHEHATRKWGSNIQVFVFSDHGMSTVSRFLNLERHLRKGGTGFQRDYLCFVDSTMARFWYRNERGRQEAHELMARIPNGHFLSNEEKQRYGVDFPSDDYGEEVYLLKSDTAFFPAYVSWLQPVGMHGFACDDHSQDGVFMWLDGTGERRLPHRVRMTDIAPTILNSIGLAADPRVTGKVWK